MDKALAHKMCVICLKEIPINVVASIDSCTHLYCFDCIREWANK